MKEVDADYTAINNFVKQVENGTPWLLALNRTKVKHPEIHNNTYDFVEHTLNIATTG